MCQRIILTTIYSYSVYSCTAALQLFGASFWFALLPLVPIKQPSKKDDQSEEDNDENADKSQDDKENNTLADKQDKSTTVSEQAPIQASVGDDTLTTPLLVRHGLFCKYVCIVNPNCCPQAE